MMLAWSGLAASPDDLTAQVYLPDRRGSLQSSLVAATRRRDRLAYPVNGLEALLAEVAAGHPVLVLQNLGPGWLPRWHYAVVYGYDLARQEVTLHSGVQAARRVGLAAFDRTWQRAGQWGLLVLPPGRLPARAHEQIYLKAALGLQQAGAGQAALMAFETAAQRWPESPVVHLSLGNARYGSGDLAGAASAFGRASDLDPRNGAAFNNLGHVLARLGRWEEAETAARRAVELGGPQSERFRGTLDEILRRAVGPAGHPPNAR